MIQPLRSYGLVRENATHLEHAVIVCIDWQTGYERAGSRLGDHRLPSKRGAQTRCHAVWRGGRRVHVRVDLLAWPSKSRVSKAP
jgi:hypothetical protein